MKKIFTIALLSLFILSCKAQTIVPQFGSGHTGVINYYYKDVDIFFNPYEGDWIYTNGNTSLKIRLLKKERVLFTNSLGSYYEDVLVGEYEYIENGILRINTLNNLNINHISSFNYNLYDLARIRKNIYPLCPECATDEYRIKLNYNEPEYQNYQGFGSYMVIRKVVENGVEKLKLKFIEQSREGFRAINGDINNLEFITANYKIPFGEYTLIKQ